MTANIIIVVVIAIVIIMATIVVVVVVVTIIVINMTTSSSSAAAVTTSVAFHGIIWWSGVSEWVRLNSRIHSLLLLLFVVWRPSSSLVR